MADQGEQEKQVAGPVAYDVKTRLPVPGLEGAELARALLAGTHTVETGGTVQVLAPDGRTGTVPADKIVDALKSGYSLDTPAAREARQWAKEHPVLAGARSFGTGVAEGLLPGALEQLPPPEDRQQFEARNAEAEKQAPVLNAVGTGVGVAAPALAGLGEVGGLARGAEALVLGERAVPKALEAGAAALERSGLETLATETAKNAAPSVLRRAAATGAKVAVEGALTSAPEAAHHAFEGDPERAAEAIMWGAGLGAVLGSLGSLGGSAVDKGLDAGRRYAAAQLSQLSSEDVSGALSKAARRAAGSAVHAVGGAIGAGHGGWLGGTVGWQVSRPIAHVAGALADSAVKRWLETDSGQVAQRWLKDLATAPLQKGFGEGMALQGTSVLQQRLSRVPAAIAAIGSEKATEPHTAVDPAEAGHVSAMAQQLAANPEALSVLTAEVAAPLDHSLASAEVATALQNRLTNAVEYIATNAPKPPVPVPFSTTRWVPSPLDLAAQARRLEVIYDPFSVVRRLEDGTLTQEHVDALRAVYPRTFQDLQKAIAEVGVRPDAPRLTVAQRQKLGMLMGVPMDRLQTPEAVRALQSVFQPAAPSQGGPPPPSGPKRGPGRPPKARLDKWPTLATTVQRIEHGEPGKGS